VPAGDPLPEKARGLELDDRRDPLAKASNEVAEFDRGSRYRYSVGVAPVAQR
jgi:hypothetical protein